MLRERIERKWIETFAETFTLCKIGAGDPVAILSETLSRQINVHLAELALLEIGARPYHIVLPSAKETAGAAVRSTGASWVIDGVEPVINALADATMIADITVEGTMHAPEGPAIRGNGARLLYISNEHPEILERLKPSPKVKELVFAARKLVQACSEMHVTSEAGTDLRINMRDARVGGNVGYVEEPGQLATWPGGTCSSFPPLGAVNGTLVLDEGDLNLTFKRYLAKPIRITIEDDFATDIAGEGLDADLMRSYFAVWGDREAYGASHVGFGVNPGARWDSMMFYDRGDTNGVEQRAYAGNFLYSTGANPAAERYTQGHFDLPVGKCTITLDNQTVVERGQLAGPLAELL